MSSGMNAFYTTVSPLSFLSCAPVWLLYISYSGNGVTVSEPAVHTLSNFIRYESCFKGCLRRHTYLCYTLDHGNRCLRTAPTP